MTFNSNMFTVTGAHLDNRTVRRSINNVLTHYVTQWAYPKVLQTSIHYVLYILLLLLQVTSGTTTLVFYCVMLPNKRYQNCYSYPHKHTYIRILVVITHSQCCLCCRCPLVQPDPDPLVVCYNITLPGETYPNCCTKLVCP